MAYAPIPKSSTSDLELALEINGEVKELEVDLEESEHIENKIPSIFDKLKARRWQILQCIFALVVYWTVFLTFFYALYPTHNDESKPCSELASSITVNATGTCYNFTKDYYGPGMFPPSYCCSYPEECVFVGLGESDFPLKCCSKGAMLEGTQVFCLPHITKDDQVTLFVCVVGGFMLGICSLGALYLLKRYKESFCTEDKKTKTGDENVVQ